MKQEQENQKQQFGTGLCRHLFQEEVSGGGPTREKPFYLIRNVAHHNNSMIRLPIDTNQNSSLVQ